MNDWWNDPPEELEIPVCPHCTEYGSEHRFIASGIILKCDDPDCGYEWVWLYPPALTQADIDQINADLEEFANEMFKNHG